MPCRRWGGVVGVGLYVAALPPRLACGVAALAVRLVNVAAGRCRRRRSCGPASPPSLAPFMVGKQIDRKRLTAGRASLCLISFPNPMQHLKDLITAAALVLIAWATLVLLMSF